MRNVFGNMVVATLFVAVFGPFGCTKAEDAVSDRKAPLLDSADVVRNSFGGCNVTPNPGPEQVFVFSDKGYRNLCRILLPGFYPDPSNIGMPDNWISSIKVGSAVRVKAFADSKYSGNSLTLSSNAIDLVSYGFNEMISSIRVEDRSRPTDCSDTRPGEVGLFGGVLDLTGPDCVNVTSTHDLPDESAMGIQNDTLGRVVNLSGKTINLFTNANYQSLCLSTAETNIMTGPGPPR